jgi:hypothetical protein
MLEQQARFLFVSFGLRRRCGVKNGNSLQATGTTKVLLTSALVLS